MQQRLLDHSEDLKRLRDEGYKVSIKGSYALVDHIPYVNNNGEILFGTLVSSLSLQGDKTIKPDTHVIHFIGDHPCEKDGTKMVGIQHVSTTTDLGGGIIINHSFSNKPPEGYADYYEKFIRYIEMVEAPAKSIDAKVTARIFELVEAEEDSVFNYLDTSSSRANIGAAVDKIKQQKIGIIGVGGTGSYVLDLVSKTPVRQIDVYDGDRFLQHNAFRSPGAANKEQFGLQRYKADYFKEIYDNMHKGIVTHNHYLDEYGINDLAYLDFVFICIDECSVKKEIIKLLIENEIQFVDVGMGLQLCDGSIVGSVRTTIGKQGDFDLIKNHISFVDDSVDEAYTSNIQIAELNALNASFAVIQWKKLYGYYQDLSDNVNVVYSINDGEVINYGKKN